MVYHSVANTQKNSSISMELIIKKEGFSEDFKDKLGFVDSDIAFNRIKPSLEIATDEIIDIITKENYNQVISKLFPPEVVPETEITENQDLEPENPKPDFNSLSEDLQIDFVDLIKYAIYLKAFILYVPTGDLSVGNNGRTMRRDDHTVAAFQWQIDKHDESLEQLYYRHLDRLLRFMFENDLEVNQKKYDYKYLLVNSIDVFETHFDINGSRLLYLKLLPAMREAERLMILSRTGEEIFNQIKENPDSDLAFLVKKCLVNSAMIWGIYRLNLQLFPKGLLQQEKDYSNKKQADPVQRQGLALVFERDLDKNLEELEKQILILQTPEVPKEEREFQLPEIGFNKEDSFVDL